MVVNDVGDDDDFNHVDSPITTTRKSQELPNSTTMASMDFRTSNREKESKSQSVLDVDVVGDDESPNIDSPRLGVMEFIRTNLPTLDIFVTHDQLLNF
jgi:hypothetical protein